MTSHALVHNTSPSFHVQLIILKTTHVSLQMKCRFMVYSVPWEKRKDLESHECVGLEEKLLSCERSDPVKQVSETDQTNMVEEMFIESKV